MGKFQEKKNSLRLSSFVNDYDDDAGSGGGSGGESDGKMMASTTDLTHNLDNLDIKKNE